jgi:hypothetical protein
MTAHEVWKYFWRVCGVPLVADVPQIGRSMSCKLDFGITFSDEAAVKAWKRFSAALEA